MSIALQPIFLTRALWLMVFLFSLSGSDFDSRAQSMDGKNVVNLYGWHAQIPDSLLTAFTKETGIEVIYDVYDSNDVLEAKLLAGHTGYDVVFPTAWPYAARQAKAGLYAPLERTKLSNYHHIGPSFLKRMEKADPGNAFVVPYTWGLVALGYRPDLLPDDIPKKDLDSWALVYDPGVLSNVTKYGVTLVEDPLDVYTTFYLYQGHDPTSTSFALLKETTQQLKTLRPYYRRFGTNLVAEQLGNGELAVVMHWSGILSTARERFERKGTTTPIKIVLPREGTMMWIDCMAIPKDAPHLDNAHKFIDFLLRPENAAAITNAVYTATTITKSRALLRPEIRTNQTIFPDDNYMEKVMLPEIDSLQHQRRMSRLFASLVTAKQKK